ncbi:MAG: TraR/DksA family transcriptional regulator [Planctomycetota bacterium]|nr:TraR/DksA family transcriptional regulator [Planctomycetota bacterium]
MLLTEKQRQISNHMQTELSELEAAPERSHSGDLEEIASETDGTDSLCEIMDIEASQIGQIETALKKIDEGTYGICEDCGSEISSERIKALPFASQCIDCKRKAEIAGELSPYPARTL